MSALAGFDDQPTGAVVFGWLVGNLTGDEARALAEILAAPAVLVPNCDFDSGLDRGEFSVVVGIAVAVARGDPDEQGTPAGERVSFSPAELSAASASFGKRSKELRKLIAANCEEVELSGDAAAWVVGAGPLATGRVIAPRGLFRLDGDEAEAAEEVSGSADEGASSFRLAPKVSATLVVQYD